MKNFLKELFKIEFNLFQFLFLVAITILFEYILYSDKGLFNYVFIMFLSFLATIVTYQLSKLKGLIK